MAKEQELLDQLLKVVNEMDDRYSITFSYPCLRDLWKLWDAAKVITKEWTSLKGATDGKEETRNRCDPQGSDL